MPDDAKLDAAAVDPVEADQIAERMKTISPTAISVLPLQQTTDKAATSDSIARLQATAVADLVYWISAPDWTDATQKMVAQIQTSKDGGSTWQDVLVAQLGPTEGGVIALGISRPDNSKDLLSRCVCRVTGSIAFGLSGESK